MDRRRSRVWALAIVVAIGVGALVALAVDGDDEGRDGSSSSSTTDHSTTSTTSGRSTSTASTTTTTTVGPGAVPDAVTVVSAGSGAGSGEVVLDWDAVAGATGYRVLRSEVPDGPFEVVADLDVTTGSTTAEADVVNIWSEQHTYIPAGDALTAPDESPWFQYVDISTSERRCYRVIARNAAGDGPASTVTCGSPP